MKLLRDLYPGVDWNRVDFYEGLPWFTPMVAPYVTAQALPRFYSFSGFRIYLSKFDETRAQCLADIVHEAFHIMQAMEFNKGYGVGFFRGFMFYYIAHFLKVGYRNNPFEIPAYDQEYRFLKFTAFKGFHGISPPLREDAFSDAGSEAELVFRKFDFKYQGNALMLPASFLVCVIVTFLKPFMDIVAFIAGLPGRQRK